MTIPVVILADISGDTGKSNTGRYLQVDRESASGLLHILFRKFEV